MVIENKKARMVKKDAKGISVTEVYHILNMVNKSHKISIEDISEIEKLLNSKN